MGGKKERRKEGRKKERRERREGQTGNPVLHHFDEYSIFFRSLASFSIR